jgi:phthalate 4,5-cis-dihydrodiol dehydrogenase
MLGVGILGAGFFGAFHARAVAAVDGARIVAVCAEELPLAEAFAAEHGGKPFCDWRAMLDDKSVEAVAITAPHHLHCDRGELGKPVTGSSALMKTWIESNRRGWHLDPATGGGMLMTAGIHALDQLIWLMDGRVGSVSAAVSTSFHDQKADDSAMMLLRFADGRFGQVASIGFRDGAGTFGIDLVCEHGTLRIDPDRGVAIGRGGTWSDVQNSHDPHWMQNAVIREWQALASAIAHDTDVPVTGDYGRHIIACIEAAMMSAREGGDVKVMA